MAKRMGYFPEGAKPRNLVWDENNEDLYAIYLSYNYGSLTDVPLQLFCWFPRCNAFRC